MSSGRVLWKLIFGKWPFLISREPCSAHLGLLTKKHFEIACAMKAYRDDGFRPDG